RDNAVITATEPAPKEDSADNSSGTRLTQTSTIQQSGTDEVPAIAPGSRRRIAGIAALIACGVLATLFLRRTPPPPPSVPEATPPAAAATPAPPAMIVPEAVGISVTDLPIAAAAPEPSTSTSANGKRL